jgi:hypothetical protein
VPSALLVAALALPQPAHASHHAKARLADPPPDDPPTPSLPWSGRVFTDIYVPANDVNTTPYRQDSASLWLQGDPRFNDSTSAHFILTGDAIQNNAASVVGSTNAAFHAGLREAYVAYARGGWEFRAGQQILPWGKSDAINPTDFLTAKNFTIFNPDEEVRRLGAVSLLANWTPNQGDSPLTLTAVVTPIFAQSQILVPPSVVPAGISINGGVAAPPQTLPNTETAFKISYASDRWDLSLSAFRGFNHLPEFAILGTTTSGGQPTGFTIGQTFHMIRAAGGDASLTLGKWILRAESAYTWTENDSGVNPQIEPSHWDSVVGVERPIGDDFRAQLQFVYRVFPLWSSPSQLVGPDPLTTQVEQGVANANAILLGYTDINRPGATFRFAYANESSGVEAELFVYGNFVGGDYLVRPKFSYHWSDALVSTLGAEWYGGPPDQPLGAMNIYNSVFLEGKYTF